MYQIGVDIGGTNIKIGLVDGSLEIIARKKIKFSHASPESVAFDIYKSVKELLDAETVTIADLESIGLVVPGSIDPSGKIVLDAYNLGFHDVPFCKLLAVHFPKTPIYMANDADGAAVAELYKGAFVGCSTALLLTLGTGLGGGLIINGRLFRGGRRLGTEPGHAYLVAGGAACSCGNLGCMESYCSASALARRGAEAMLGHPESLLHSLSGGNAEAVDAKLITDCVNAGDAVAIAVFEQYVEWLSAACASYCNVLDPEVIAIGGGLCAAGETLFGRLRERVLQKCFFKSCGELVPAVMGNDAGIVGAAMLHRAALE